MLSLLRRSTVALVLCTFACGGDDDDGAAPGFGGFPGFGGASGTGGAGANAGTGGSIPPADPFCGDGVVNANEECERRDGCAETDRCSATCTCVPGPEYTPSSQELIERALAAGEIDYPTSLMYRVWALFQAPELPEAYDGSGSSGEDTYLFIELSRVLGSLPAEVDSAIAPYLVRPDDPTSIWSQPPPAALGSDVVAQQTMPPPVGCPANATGQPDWRAHETTNFVVWSCGGGAEGTDPYAGGRVVTGTLAEQVLSAMEPTLGRIRDDDYAAGPAPQARTDIYILTPNQCRLRNGFCTPIPPNTMAAASPTKPCGRINSGPIVTSSYLVIGANKIPNAAPAAGTPSELRYILAHEFFHAISYGINFEAQGGVCRERTDPDLPVDEARSWLTEASAEWASFVFFEADDRARRTELFRRYLVLRDQTQHGLHATLDLLPYEAFLYPLFVQEENGGMPATMVQLWKGSQAARNREDLDHRLNSLFPFVDHFRDFAVRNFNRDLPGTPIADFHAGWDEALPLDNPAAFVPEPAPELLAPLEFSHPVKIAPLAFDTWHYFLSDDVRSFRVDASDVPNVGHLSLDALVKVGDSWQHRRVEGPVFEFCRADENDDVSELYLILSNFDRDRAGSVEGNAKVTTRTSCPGGWSGVIRVTQTFEELIQLQTEFETQVTVRDNVETQEWAVIDSVPFMRPEFPGSPEVDRARVVFRGQASMFTETVTTTEDCTDTYLSTEIGSGSYPTFFDFSPGAPGTYILAQSEIGPGFMTEAVTSFAGCAGSDTYTQMHPHGEFVAYFGLAAGLNLLTEDPNDPGHFAGTANPIHEETPQTGGMNTLDVQIDWDLRRTPTR